MPPLETSWGRSNKASKDLESAEVKAKAQAGALGCKNATDHTRSVGGKPWKYLLVSHEQVTADKALSDFLRFEVPSR